MSSLHVENLKRGVFHNFNLVHPNRLRCLNPALNPVRWVHCANRALSQLLTEASGGDNKWLKEPALLKRILTSEHMSKNSQSACWDPQLFKDWRRVKQDNKHKLIAFVNRLMGEEERFEHKDEQNIICEPPLHERDSKLLFVGHLKRFSLHKRQLMNLLGIVSRYLSLKAGEGSDRVGRVAFFAGKASPEDTLNKAIV